MDVPAAELVRHPAPPPDGPIANPRIPVPPRLYGPERQNSAGFNLYDGVALEQLSASMAATLAESRSVRPDGASTGGELVQVQSPANRSNVVGTVAYASAEHADRAVAHAAAAFPA